MCTGKVAVITGLGVGAMLITQSGDPAVTGYPVWRETGLLARAVLCVLTGVSLLAVGWLYRLLFGPLELLRGPDDVGYIAEDGRSRARAANEVRRRRKTGELPPVYPNGWYRVLDSHLLQRGEVKSVSVLGEQVAVFRGQDWKAHVLEAYCPHLGANLAVGGRVVGSCIECPFHGWQFRGSDGKCVRIPYAEKVPEFAKVRCWPSCEVNGQILVWFHCDGEDPQWIVPEQQEITKGEWVYRGRTEHFINAHIEEIPENAADIAHLAHLHTPGIVSGVDLRYTNSKTWEFLRHDWKVQWEPESEPNKHCSRMLVKHSLTVFGCHWPLLDVRVVARQFERDVMIWNNKKYISKPLLVKEDAAIQKHRRWFSQFYSENSPRLQYQRDTLDF
ncbi:cholesterol 7-desaturase nvd isoform X2 [Plectropomus leopardus]|uniref:cholesterol 7-desaturase nvd isoform X2 n=1 Tax=Plectropomus leopardus TaxID=160734 RepID=UPI001C4B2BB4|nr:cholesterol 7-desaturase nvd isoform X2 [Plectropomus leopardus]